MSRTARRGAQQCGARWSLSPILLALAKSVFAAAPSQSVCAGDICVEGLSAWAFEGPMGGSGAVRKFCAAGGAKNVCPRTTCEASHGGRWWARVTTRGRASRTRRCLRCGAPGARQRARRPTSRWSPATTSGARRPAVARSLPRKSRGWEQRCLSSSHFVPAFAWVRHSDTRVCKLCGRIWYWPHRKGMKKRLQLILCSMCQCHLATAYFCCCVCLAVAESNNTSLCPGSGWRWGP